MRRIQQMLRDKIGLDSASVGSSVIERSVRLRMKRIGLAQIGEYQRLLETSRQEWEELVETVVVVETWFFRDRNSFVALVELIRRTPPPPGVMRLLSVACASGEEPYSLAMVLLDAGFSSERFVVDAVDISGKALARAQTAVYSKNSFRGKPLDFRERHFAPTPDGYALHPRVRNCVRFHRANIFEEDFLAGNVPYHFIFCRNLLIYFDRETQARAMNKLGRMLAPGGCLFVGPAEMPLATAHGFVSANLPMAFACQKVGEAPQPLPSRRGRPGRDATLPPDGTPAANAAPPPRPPASALPGVPASSAHTPPGDPELAAARALADAGKLEEAAVLCQAHLDHGPPTASAYYLLGLVREARGDPEAIACYRRALYLDPDHYETLLQMTLLLEKNGDPTAARTFRRRAASVKARLPAPPEVAFASQPEPV